MSGDFKPTPHWWWERCPICDQPVTANQAYIAGRMRRGGTQFVHLTCWKKEQAELAGKEKREK